MKSKIYIKKMEKFKMNKQVEYEAIREEILLSTQTVKNYRTLLYTIVVAILAFGFDKDAAIIFLLPFCAIIPLYLLEMRQIDSMMRLGTYIYVFLEPGTDCKWETRLLEYDKLHKNQYSTKKSLINSYWSVSLCCIALSVLKLDYCNRNFWFYFTIILQLIILIICSYLFLRKRIDYLAVKEKYIKEWEEIRKIENKVN